MSTKDINIEVLKEFRKKKAKKLSKSKNVVNIHVKNTGPPDISNRNAILKVFKTTEAYEAFRSKYLYNDFSYTLEQEDRSLEIMRNRCKNKKRRQENMYQQAIKNKKALSQNEKLHKTIFSERNYYNNYSREKLDYEAAGKLLRQSSDSFTNQDELEYDNDSDMDNVNQIDTMNEFNKNLIEDIKEEVIEEKEDDDKDKMEINENDIKENEKEEEEDDYIREKIEIVEDINRNMVEKNSSYKSFSFNDSVKATESKSNSDEYGSSRFPPYDTKSTTAKSSTRVPLSMNDLIESSPVKLPVIQPRHRNWQALSLSEVSEKRPVWNPFSNEPKKKFIIPGIDKQYQQYIPSRKGNIFWKVCDGNIYDNIF